MRIRTDTGEFVSETAAVCGWSKETGTYALAQAVNSLTAKDAVCIGVEAQIMFPAHADHVKAYEMEKCIRRVCCGRKMEWKGTRIRQSPLYKVPVVTVSGIGRVPGKDPLETAGKGMKESAEIVLVKWIGMEGMLRITAEKEDELRQRFAPVFMNQILSYRNEVFAGKELDIARRAKVGITRQITEGGILAALWELSKETGMGIETDMKRISVLQETIEVCEHYRLNPYQMTSAGSFLMLAEDGKALAEEMEKNRIKASVIGRVTAGNDKVIHNGGDIRYIDRPAPDEIYKIFI